jgi:hypothetical protein
MSVRSARDKFEEAQYFYGQLRRPDVHGDFNHVKFTLSALINAARSARWHVASEIKTNLSLKAWWDEQKIQDNPCVKYFDERRTIEVHEETAGVTRRTQIEVRASAALSGELTVLVTRADGSSESFTDPPPPPPEPQEVTPPLRRHTYMFTDYPGGEREVLDACSELIRHLEAFVGAAEENAK